MSSQNETIYALASASGRAGLSVLRVSGPHAKTVIDKLSGREIEPRKAVLRLLRDPLSKEPIDRVLLLWFPAPHSFTGEDIVEIHCHGSMAVVAQFLSVLFALENFRLAEPGEFAQRAFENGKMDLTAIEGLADLINAQTQGQRKQALRQSEGKLGDLYESWRKQVLSASSLMEALIDFSDEEDIDASLQNKARLIATDLLTSLNDHLEMSGRRGEQMRNGFRLVIAGEPNVGKSSLLNVLAQRDAAIVTSEPGTTRDVIEVRLEISGVPVLIMDTAGIRETSGVVEAEGIKRSIERFHDADLVLWLSDDQKCDPDQKVREMFHLKDKRNLVWKLLSKVDLQKDADQKFDKKFDLTISSTTDHGIEELVERIGVLFSGNELNEGEPLITRARHRQEVMRTKQSLSAFLHQSQNEPELGAEDLRQAAIALGRLTGRIDVEELLGEIFGEFCIGK